MARELTDKQSSFVEEYLVDLNATQAAIRAGYSEKTAHVIGCENLGKPKIAKAIQEAMTARSERTEVTADWVLARLVENVERSMQAEAVYDRHGNETGEYAYQGSVANKALELLGKHLAIFTDRIDLTGTVGHVELSELTDGQLQRLRDGEDLRAVVGSQGGG